ncbi:hypothetical protein O6P43_032772 [Quillaja saponaria]|uniref:Uncharacterized protein n=1 Tax=Quillaja saponaria TaxID=32244 RepID=A0AAD7KNK9_QUISA|nr:hypothetical protein O6P43_032772 [Quillaja saponaria]
MDSSLQFRVPGNLTASDMEMKSEHSLPFEAEDYDDDDDDVFYAEIRRQILLLTTEDNEDFLQTKRSNSISSVNRCSNGLHTCFPVSIKSVSHLSSWERENSASTPSWLVNLWKNGNGTGVFIPQIGFRRYHHRPVKVNNVKRRIYKPVQNGSGY